MVTTLEGQLQESLAGIFVLKMDVNFWRKCVKCFESGIDFFPDWQGFLIMTIVL